jgi:hypothetical protein
MTFTELLHGFAYRHVTLHKEDVGTYSVCSGRLTDDVRAVYFRPNFDGARWHLVPESLYQDRTDLDLYSLLNAGSAHEAMRAIRAARAEEGGYA